MLFWFKGVSFFGTPLFIPTKKMKVQSPIVGHQRGRTGGLIFQTYFGNTYARSMPALFHYPDTRKQQATQLRFYNVLRQLQPIYREFGKTIPQAQRYDKNFYTIFAKGIYKAIQAFTPDKTTENVRWFGTDKQKQVRLSFGYVKMGVSPDSIALAFNVTYTLWRRKFTPQHIHIIVLNLTKQYITSHHELYNGSDYELRIPTTTVCKPTDQVVAYLALSNYEFLSNFTPMK